MNKKLEEPARKKLRNSENTAERIVIYGTNEEKVEDFRQYVQGLVAGEFFVDSSEGDAGDSSIFSIDADYYFGRITD